MNSLVHGHGCYVACFSSKHHHEQEVSESWRHELQRGKPAACKILEVSLQ